MYMIRKILAVLAALIALSVAAVVTGATQASAVSCFAQHDWSPDGVQPWTWSNEVRYNGLATCSSSVAMTVVGTLTKNGTVVDTDTQHHTGTSWTVFAFAINPSALQYWCGRTKITWSGGSSTSSWACQYY